jgi:hypothetical protein
MGDLLNFALVKCQSPVLYRDIAAREFAVHATTIHMHNQTPNPDSQRVNTLLLRRFPYREIGGCGVECLLQHKTPNPKLRLHATCLPLTPGAHERHPRESIMRSSLGVENSETPNTDIRDLMPRVPP